MGQNIKAQKAKLAANTDPLESPHLAERNGPGPKSSNTMSSDGGLLPKVYSRGSENHAGTASQSPNHQGVSHAPNAGPAMQGHIGTPPRPYTENNLGSTQSTQMISGPAGAGRKVQTSTVNGPSASDMANIAKNAKAKK